jgi:peptidoglycan-associated lipoprotein
MRSRETGKYPVVGIASHARFRCNRDMRILSALAAFAILAACHTIRDRPYRPNLPVINHDALREPSPSTPEPTPAAASSPAVVHDPVMPTDPNGIPTDAKLGLAQRIANVNSQLRDIFYDYDRAQLNHDAQTALQHDAELLSALARDFPSLQVIVEGHCDERGSAEYNLALGDNRAATTATALRNLGLPLAKLETVSYGKENPQCTDPAESCWQKNRRAHLVVRR